MTTGATQGPRPGSVIMSAGLGTTVRKSRVAGAVWPTRPLNQRKSSFPPPNPCSQLFANGLNTLLLSNRALPEWPDRGRQARLKQSCPRSPDG